jgi:hypothetical protein
MISLKNASKSAFLFVLLIAQLLQRNRQFKLKRHLHITQVLRRGFTVSRGNFCKGARLTWSKPIELHLTSGTLFLIDTGIMVNKALRDRCQRPDSSSNEKPIIMPT